jgi:hypothetical protein
LKLRDEPLTVEDIDRAIAAEKAEIVRHQGRLVALESLRLQFAGDRTNTVRNMQPTQSVRPRRSRRGRPPRGNHPFVLALDARGSSLADWARQHQLDEELVRGWVRDADGRRIPRDVAEMIEKEMGKDENDQPLIPATLATWKNGIR